MKKLIIWDFDGVIADTEHIAMNKYVEISKRYRLNLSMEDVIKYILGKGEQKQLETLISLGKNVDAKIVKQINDEITEFVMQNISLTPNIEEIFKLKKFEQCIATGNSMKGIKARLEALNLNYYFSEKNVFSASFVEHGKPEPDLFLYASDKMNYIPENCIVIEDSVYGIEAALKANMTVIAYLEHILYDKQEYIKQVNSLGKVYFCDNMRELKKMLS